MSATVTANQDGTYRAAPLYFFMPGVWRVSFSVPANQLSDVGDFYFCIPG